MPRNRTRTTTRGFSADVIEAAAKRVDEGWSVRAAAAEHKLCHVSLLRYLKKRQNEGGPPDVGYHPHNRVLSALQEDDLTKYLLKAADLYFGLSPKDVRKLVYEYAVVNKCKVPENWHAPAMASADWFTGYLIRNPRLSIRKPEATSLARAMNFNKPNVAKFFNNLSDVMDRFKFEPHNIYNVDETATSPVQVPTKVVAGKGNKQIGSIVSNERGTTVTLCCAINAIGGSVPPMFVFPRIRYKDHFVRDGPVGCIGTGNDSGWMTEKEFFVFIQHFCKHAKPSKDSKVLLLLDNHSSHLSLQVINFCRENGIVLVSFPPHCSHKLQPLDRGAYGPLKRYFFAACDTWMKAHPGTRMTIYDIPSIVNQAYPLALSVKNILACFACTGIYPFNRDIFDDADFAPSETTDRPAEELVDNEPQVEPDEVMDVHDEDNNDAQLVSPEEIRPHPKAKFSQKTKGGRARGKTAILTDTPEKEAIESAEKQRNAKRLRFEQRKKSTGEKARKTTASVSKPNAPSSENECVCLVCDEKFANSREGEMWMQCKQCKGWAHGSCVSSKKMYVCDQCA